MAAPNRRADHTGQHRTTYEKNRKRILATQDICGICGKPVDKSLKSPHPLSATVDHIIPIAKGGHPSDIENLQLAHRNCNRQKSDKLIDRSIENNSNDAVRNDDLPWSFNWRNYRG